MGLCPPFGWPCAKGGFYPNKVKKTRPARPERRETIAIFPSELGENGISPTTIKKPSLPSQYTSSAPESKKASNVSIISSTYQSNYHSEATTPRGSETELTDSERKSSAGRKTIADLVAIGPTHKEKVQVNKRRAVIANAVSADTSDLNYEKYPKDERSAAQISKAVMANDFLKNLMDQDRLIAVVEAMSPQEFPAGNLIIREGESGSHLFVSAYGQFEVLKGGQVVKTFGAGEAFGELAILYKAKRFASIRCITDAKVWTLERRVFQKIMVRSGRQEQEDNIRFLASVPLLQGMHPIELTKISGFLKREFFSAGTAVVKQGDRGDKFYIIRGGTVVVTKREGEEPEVRVGTLRRGDYFGEQALLHKDRRLATVTAQPPGVECLTLERGPFTRLLGGVEELLNTRHAEPGPTQQNKTSIVKSENGLVN